MSNCINYNQKNFNIQGLTRLNEDNCYKNLRNKTVSKSGKYYKTIHPRIFKSEEPFIEFSELDEEINMLQELIVKNDLENILNKIRKIVVDYSPNCKIIDHTFIKNY